VPSDTEVYDNVLVIVEVNLFVDLEAAMYVRREGIV
jgi:hypothetical protein